VARKDFLLPDLGEGLTEGEIVSWLVAVGDTIEVDQPVAEVETAKAVVEVPSPFAGTVIALHGEVGQEVEVGRPLVTIEVVGAAVAPAEPVARTESSPVTEPVPAGAAAGQAEDLIPDVTTGPDDSGGSGSVLVGYGTGGGTRSRRRRGAVPAGPAARGPAAGAPPPRPAAAPPATARPRAKPPVRRLAKELGVDLTTVQGTGPEGIITREDVERHARGDGRAAVQPEAVPGGSAAEVDYGPAYGEAEEAGVVVTSPTHERLASAPPNAEIIPLRGVRRVIAEKMTASRREIPEAVTWVDCDATELWDLRQRLNAEQGEVRVTPLAIILRICVAGLREYPELNASIDTQAGEIRLHRHVNLGFAAQTGRGLVVPVIKGAHTKSTLAIAKELNRLAEAARAGTVTPEEMSGGTFTVSNYGSFGVDGGSAVINYPEAAILGVGQIADRPWVVGGQLQVRKVMQLSIAFDHRIADGGQAAGFLRFVADCVESPTRLLGLL
jgi:pyruvate dehydrogenase E2 component (dihydrolipoamide acetyltransferase)